jgi:hypothetical protein
MLEILCHTCGELLGHKQLIYEAKMKSACESIGIDYDSISLGVIDDTEKFRKIRQDIVLELCDQICCKQALMNFIDLVHLVKG